MLNLSEIIYDRLDARNDYFKEVAPKGQIFIHHSYSHADPAVLMGRWRNSPVKAACALIIGGEHTKSDGSSTDGTIYSTFPSKYWGIHLAVHHPENQVSLRYKNREHSRFLEKHSIGIQLCNAGALSWENGKFYTMFRTVVPEENVIEYVDEFRGQRFFQRYTDAQIASLREMLHYLCDRYQIDRTYRPGMWDVSEAALLGQEGIFTHASVRSDKMDCHPQPELIEMLRGLAAEAKISPEIGGHGEEEIPEETLNAEAEEGQQQEELQDDGNQEEKLVLEEAEGDTDTAEEDSDKDEETTATVEKPEA